MKKVNSFIAICFSVAFLLLANSCSKTGPAGPAGTGSTGPAGPTGAAGPAGATGTANVIYSPWLDVAFTLNNGTYAATIAAAKLDSLMLLKGEIKVYINTGYAAAPDILAIPFWNTSIIINDEFKLNTINLSSNIDASTGTDASGKYQQYRYVLVPGGTGARSAINWNNYAEVKKYLNLKD
ncbi:MAG: hypothetical protein ABJB86_23740 [Bacteroidota bacterium]